MLLRQVPREAVNKGQPVGKWTVWDNYATLAFEKAEELPREVRMHRSPAFPPAILILCTVIAACVVADAFDMRWIHILPPYLLSGIFATLSGLLVYCSMRFVSAFRRERDLPFRRRQVAIRYLLEDLNWGAVGLSLLGIPVFLSAYTTVKSALPFFAAYTWDEPLAALEYFGRPSWQWLHAIMPATDWMAIIYTKGWVAAMLLFLGYAACRNHYRVITAYFLTWVIGGLILAALFASTGPLGEVPTPALTSTTQKYLLASMGSHYVLESGGVSAMPSMHIATCVLINIYAYRTWLFWPTMLFTMAIWILSVHLGFHYASDGIAAAGIALVCWKLAACLTTTARLPYPVLWLPVRRRVQLLPVPTRK